MRTRLIAVILSSVFFAGCGGGEDGSSSNTGVAPSLPFQYQLPPTYQSPPAPDSPVATSVLHQTVLVSGGSGYFIRRNFILTNWHVVRGYIAGATQTAPVPVTLRSGVQHLADIVAFTPNSDIALLKISDPDSPEGLPFGQSHDLRQGSAVFTIGNRLQAGWVYVGGNFREHTFLSLPCDGTASGFQEVAIFSGDVADGNSGGALFNSLGQVVGMVSCRGVSSNTGEVTGVALPSEVITLWLNRLDWAQIER